MLLGITTLLDPYSTSKKQPPTERIKCQNYKKAESQSLRSTKLLLTLVTRILLTVVVVKLGPLFSS